MIGVVSIMSEITSSHHVHFCQSEYWQFIYYNSFPLALLVLEHEVVPAI